MSAARILLTPSSTGAYKLHTKCLVRTRDLGSRCDMQTGRIHTTCVCAVAYPGFQREGCLRSGPIQKVGGGGGALQVRYTKSGGGGGGIPLQVRYFWAHRKYLHDRTAVCGPMFCGH